MARKTTSEETAMTEVPAQYSIGPVQQQAMMTPERWQMIQGMALSVYQARVFGAFSGDEVAVKMLVAQELGLPLTSAIKSIFIVNQRPAIDTLTGMALIFRSGLLDKIQEKELLDAKGGFVGWEIYMRRAGGAEVTRRFTMDDAKRAGLLSKDNWGKYPSQMCNYRAKAFASRALFPDVLLGLNFVEEFDQPIINGQWVDAAPTAETHQVAPQAETSITMELLIDAFGVDAIMTANDGRIPGTDDEVKAIAQKLGVSC